MIALPPPDLPLCDDEELNLIVFATKPAAVQTPTPELILRIFEASTPRLLLLL